MSSKVRVLVVEDHPDVRNVIRALLDSENGYQVVGEATNGEEGIRAADQQQPDVVLLDLAMPVMDGLTALPEIQQMAPDAKIVVLSGFGTDRTVHAAMQAGASAFVHKDADMVLNLVRVIERVVEGQSGIEHPA